MTHVFDDWKFVPFDPLHLFPPRSPPASDDCQSLLFIYELREGYGFYLFVFIFYVSVESNSICLFPDYFT